MERANLAAHGSLLTAHSRRWPVEFESASARRERWERAERAEAKELAAIRAMLDDGPPLKYRERVAGFLWRDDHDGYLVTRQEVGPDPYDYNWPKQRVRPPRRVRKRNRPATARDRLAKVKPSLRIVPTGPRSAELVITRRMHEVKTGLPEALDLARMIEGAIKFRKPPKRNRKQSWRQQLRSAVLYRPGLLTFLVRNPVDFLEPGVDGRESGELGKPVFDRTTTPGTCGPLPYAAGTLTLTLSQREKESGELLGAARTPGPGSRLPAPAFAPLPREYSDLIDRQWLTPETSLFEAAPAGVFATTVEGFRLRLPVAVMPPAVYERWLARRGIKRRRRKHRAGPCQCYMPPDVSFTLTSVEKPKDGSFLRN